MPQSARRAALITGASSGIGYELTRLFARDHYDLVLTARNAGRLSEVAAEISGEYGVSVKTIARDHAEPSAARDIFDEVQREGISIDVLVNNAGFGGLGTFAETSLKRNMEMLTVNAAVLTELTGLFLPLMLGRRSGRILNVASTAAFQPGPLMSVYYASKAYVVSFSQALANEVRGTGVTVSVLCPGPTATNFQKNAGTERSPIFKAVMMSAASVAEAGYRGMMTGKTLVVPGLLNKIHVSFVRFLPRRLIPRLVRAVQEPRRVK